jgi:hypothetical protein
MKTLEIALFGLPNEIVIGSMTKEQKSQLEAYCEKEDLFSSDVLCDEELTSQFGLGEWDCMGNVNSP